MQPCGLVGGGRTLSRITDVILIFNVSELYDEDVEELAEVPVLVQLTAWFQSKGRGMLDNLDQHTITNRPMQACVYGGAYNFFEREEFVRVVRSLPWRQPQNVQLLTQGEEEQRFTVHPIA